MVPARGQGSGNVHCDYVYMSTDQQSADMMYVICVYERADEFGKIIKERKDQYPTASHGVKGKEET